LVKREASADSVPGALRVYRVPGSVAFLNSGKTLHPILKKSQCWCVDGETKFVLRIRGHNYYRIELPNTCEEDRNAADDLRRVLADVAQFETTACPFKRGFHVDLPEKQETPKRPWQPKHRSITGESISVAAARRNDTSSVVLDQENENVVNTDEERASDSTQTKILEPISEPGEPRDAFRQSEDVRANDRVEAIVSAFEELKASPNAYISERARSRSRSKSPVRRATVWLNSSTRVSPNMPSSRNPFHGDIDDTHPASTMVMQHGTKPIATEASIVGERDDMAQTSQVPLAADHPLPLRDKRSFTVPLSMSSENGRTNLEGHRTWISSIELMRHHKEEPDYVNSVGSSPLLSSPIAPTSPWALHSPQSANDDRDDIWLPRLRTDNSSQQQGIINSGTSSSEGLLSPAWPHSSSLESPGLKDMPSFYADAQSDTEQFLSPKSSRGSSPPSSLRRRFSHPRSQSPLPPPVNLYAPRDQVSRYHITTAVFQKTCRIILAPPARLVAMMLNIAQRISAGVITGESSMNIESGRRIPCSWDSDEDEYSTHGLQYEDDFGVGLHGHDGSVKSRRVHPSTNASSEVD
jgi:hypothetical protein